MRELTNEKSDQVSAGPTPFTPVTAIPTILDGAAGTTRERVDIGPDVPPPLQVLVNRGGL